ncbi:MAG: hypothetical protein JWL92_72 [Candidatus Nomurabacteria bacterium]|nr:hypothetical protein [Candidatus Nomurabacteria bacterium]
METIENKKVESKTVVISKNAIICGLAIALVLMTAATIGLAVSREEGHGDRNEQGQESMMRDDNNTNPNDGEVQDDQQPAAGTTAVPAPATSTTVQAQ